jgi:hypothetical protein
VAGVATTELVFSTLSGEIGTFTESTAQTFKGNFTELVVDFAAGGHHALNWVEGRVLRMSWLRC